MSWKTLDGTADAADSAVGAADGLESTLLSRIGFWSLASASAASVGYSVMNMSTTFGSSAFPRSWRSRSSAASALTARWYGRSEISASK